MHLFVLYSISILLISFTPNSIDAFATTTDRILESSIPSLLFQIGQYTTHQRVTYGREQLKCVSGCNLWTAVSAKCDNSGLDDKGKVIWLCITPDMPLEYKFGTTNIQCEGWDNAADPYILQGSCALNYAILPKIFAPSVPVTPATPASADDSEFINDLEIFGSFLVIISLSLLAVALICNLIINRCCTDKNIDTDSTGEKEHLISNLPKSPPPPYNPNTDTVPPVSTPSVQPTPQIIQTVVPTCTSSHVHTPPAPVLHVHTYKHKKHKDRDSHCNQPNVNYVNYGAHSDYNSKSTKSQSKGYQAAVFASSDNI